MSTYSTKLLSVKQCNQSNAMICWNVLIKVIFLVVYINSS